MSDPTPALLALLQLGRRAWLVPALALIWPAYRALALLFGWREQSFTEDDVQNGLIGVPVYLLAVGLGVRIIASEIEQRTLEVTYTVPGGAKRVWMAKLVGALLPLVVAALLVAVQFAVQLALWTVGSSAGYWTSSPMFWTETIASLGVPLALATGLLWSRSARSAVADLVVELERTPPGSVRDALARTLGDPSLELALWLPEQRIYVDGEGKPVELPAPASGRAVTVLGPADAPVG